MASNRVELNPAGVLELLSSPAVRADLERRAAAVKAAAGADAVVDIGMTSGSRGGAIRPRARIHLTTTMNIVHARRHEAKHGTLARALAAGGG